MSIERYKNIKEKILDNITIDPITNCWNWKRCHIPGGYGQVRWNGQRHLVHRLAYEAWKEKIPLSGQRLCICHKCDNPKCCNPDHLWVGTDADNVKDCINKNRNQSYQEITGENNMHSKLNNIQVLMIRQKHEAGNTTAELVKEFNVTDNHIRNILKRKSWKHI